MFSLLVRGIWNEALRDGISCYADVSIQNRSILQNVVVVAVLYVEFPIFLFPLTALILRLSRNPEKVLLVIL